MCHSHCLSTRRAWMTKSGPEGPYTLSHNMIYQHCWGTFIILFCYRISSNAWNLYLNSHWCSNDSDLHKLPQVSFVWSPLLSMRLAILRQGKQCLVGILQQGGPSLAPLLIAEGPLRTHTLMSSKLWVLYNPLSWTGVTWMQSIFSGQGCKVALVKTEGQYVIQYNSNWKNCWGNIVTTVAELGPHACMGLWKPFDW